MVGCGFMVYKEYFNHVKLQTPSIPNTYLGGSINQLNCNYDKTAPSCSYTKTSIHTPLISLHIQNTSSLPSLRQSEQNLDQK